MGSPRWAKAQAHGLIAGVVIGVVLGFMTGNWDKLGSLVKAVVGFGLFSGAFGVAIWLLERIGKRRQRDPKAGVRRE